MKTIRITLVAFALSILSAEATAGTFIDAQYTYDMVHDYSRNILYITNKTQLLRYHIGSNSFLPPFELGGYLIGIDLSPDGDTIAIADLDYNYNNAWIYLIDLKTETTRKVLIPRREDEGGTYSVAFGKDGGIFITRDQAGYSPVSLYQPLTGMFREVLVLRDLAVVNSSADRTILGFVESNSSDGPWGRIRVSDGDTVFRTGYADGTAWFNYEIGVNRDGTQFAIPTYGGTFIYDKNFEKMTTIGEYAGPQPVGVVYHPIEDIVYFAWPSGMQIQAYDTNTFKKLQAYDTGQEFYSVNYPFYLGRLKISRDGSLIFLRVTGGVYYEHLNDPLIAYNQNVAAQINQPAPIMLAGRIGNRTRISYTITEDPQHGTLTGTPPYLTYTPMNNYSGPDSITFKIGYGPASSIGKVTIAVEGNESLERIPQISQVTIKGKNLLVSGKNFDSQAAILVDGVEQRTSQVSSSRLKGKKLARSIEPGKVVVIQVRNSDGTVSNTVTFTRS
jgi:hypothetical protein